MEQVTIRCGNCNNLMGISSEHLGQQVQCPSCQSVVQAPAPEMPVEQAQTFEFESTAEEHESIFGTPEQTDDIFDNEPAPQVEMPQESTATPPIPGFSSDPVMAAPPSVEPSPPAPNLEIGESAPPPPSPFEAAPPSPPTEPEAPPPSDVPAWLGGGGDSAPAAETSEALPPSEGMTDSPVTGATAPPLPSGPRRRDSGGGWGMPLLIIPLFSWAILATVLAAMLKHREGQRPPHPLEMMPDIEGDRAPGNPEDKKQSRRRRGYGMPPINTTIPDHLMTTLGKPIQIGHLEVTPLRVEMGKITIKTVGGRSELEFDDPSLKLLLKVKNTSKSYTFSPFDSYFVRRYPSKKSEEELHEVIKTPTPFTYLTVGDKRLYGGASMWSKPGRPGPKDLVVGQNINKELKPGEEWTTFICTDPSDKDAVKTLRSMKKTNKLLWRVLVRRGAVWVEDSWKSATAVIGVEFSPDQIKQ